MKFHAGWVAIFFPFLSVLAPAAEPAIKITLLDPGKEPRREMRYSPKPAADTDFTVERSRSLEIEIVDSSVPNPDYSTLQRVKDPPVKTLEKSRVGSIGEERDVQVEESITRFTVDPADAPTEFRISGAQGRNAVEQARLAWNKIANQKVTRTISSRGILKRAIPKRTPRDYMRLGIAGESFRAANDVVFPEEPIGAGAKWSMEIRVPIDGLDFNSRTVFQLTKVDNDLLSIISELKGESLAKEVKMENTIPGSRIEVQQMKFAGTGENQIRLSQGLIPVTSSFKINLDSKLKMSAPPDRIVMMSQKVLMECKVKSINNPDPALAVPQNPPLTPKK